VSPRSILPALLLSWCTATAAFAAGDSAPIQAPEPIAELSMTDAIVLGVVEGVTEYLPVSSTGHLIIANEFLGLESERPLTDKAGQPLWYKKPSGKHPEGVPLTVKLAADTYSVVIQFGAIAAVAILYWGQMLSMLRGLFGRDAAGRRLLINLIVAFIPAGALSYLAHDWIAARLFSVEAVIVAQVAGAGLMLWVEARRRRQASTQTAATVEELTPKQALGIGMWQCLALWPGTSRSMTTIVGGYFAGFAPRKAAEFSFLLGFVTLSAASLYKGYKSGAAMIQVFGWVNIALGCAVATIVAALSVRFLVNWLTRHGLGVFAYYRLVIAAVLGTLLATGWLQ
jgi:undecaprenyl-diphosphatase